MDKGTRVKIISGRKGKDQTGEVFWTGANKWGSGERLGVRGDDGETYWVADSDVELHSGAAPVVEAGRTYSKGDRVAFKRGGEPGTGTVFWIGDSRNGPGQRLGIRDDADEDEAVWLDARFVDPLDGDAPSAAAGAVADSGGQQGGFEAAPAYDEGPPPEPTEMPPLDDGPSLDQGYFDQLAADVDDDAAGADEGW